MPNDVHPQVQAILDATAESGVPKIQDLSPGEARQLIEKMADARRKQFPPPCVESVEDLSTGADFNRVPVRIYRPNNTAGGPVLVYYHGGGHVFGSLDTHDTITRNLCNVANCTVISVDYRMGPEHRFPAAVNDAFDAARWVSEHARTLRVDRNRLALGGDSAGGNLAAVVALMARDERSFPIASQCLVYPVVDYRCATPSYERYAEGYGLLEAPAMRWFQQHYLGDEVTSSDWRASPTLSHSHENLPPTLLLSAQCDVLHDEGMAYGQCLKDAGVDVEQVNYVGMVHGFFGFLGLVDDAAHAHRGVADFLSRHWA